MKWLADDISLYLCTILKVICKMLPCDDGQAGTGEKRDSSAKPIGSLTLSGREVEWSHAAEPISLGKISHFFSQKEYTFPFPFILLNRLKAWGKHDLIPFRQLKFRIFWKLVVPGILRSKLPRSVVFLSLTPPAPNSTVHCYLPYWCPRMLIS